MAARKTPPLAFRATEGGGWQENPHRLPFERRRGVVIGGGGNRNPSARILSDGGGW